MEKNIKYLLRLFLLTLSITIASNAITADALAVNHKITDIIINSKDSIYNISSNINVINDPLKNKTFHSVLKEYRSGNGYHVRNNKIYIPNSSSAYWIIFKIKNKNPLKEKWLLNLGERSNYITGIADKISLFSSKNHYLPIMIDGRNVKNKIHILGQEKNTLPIKIKPFSEKTFALYIDPMPGVSIIISPKIIDPNYYYKFSKSHNNKYGVISKITFLFIVALLALMIKYKTNTPLILAVYIGIQFIIYKTYDEIIPLGNNTSAIYIDLLYAFSSILSLTLLYEILNYSKSKMLNDLRKISILLMVVIAFIYLSGSLSDSIKDMATYINIRFIPIFIAGAILTITLIATIKKEIPQSLSFEISWVIIIFSLMLREADIFTTAQFSSININLYPLLIILHILLLVFSSLDFSSKIEIKKYWLKKDKETKEKIATEFSKSKEPTIQDNSQLLSIMQKEKDLIIDLKNREAGKMQEMGHAKEEADKENKAKTDFLAVISHEIRTPMTGIMGLINLLKDTELNSKQIEYVETLDQTGNILLMLLNDILDFSKADAGQMDIEEIDFSINELVKNVVTMMDAPAKEKNIKLESKLSSNVPSLLKGDPARIRQILTNLVSNAIKFTIEGSVTIYIDLHKTNIENFEIFFSVKDSGIGISEDVQENLFKPYTQAGASISRKFGGTGLGLSICHRLINAMGGNIELKSTPGKGTIFYFILPLKKPDKNSLSSPVIIAPSLINKRATAINQEVLTKHKETEKTPLDTAPKAATKNKAKGVGKILIVDDNALNQKVISALLEKDHHDITTVGSVIDAMNQIGKNYFDIIFMDMEMPEINGLTATGMIRSVKDKKKAKTPVIAMTAHTDEESISKCIQAGMNDHISKPIDIEKIRSIISHILKEDERLNETLGSALPEPNPEETKIQKIADLKELSLDVVKEHLNEKTFNSIKNSMGEDKTREIVLELYKSINELITGAEKALSNKKMSDVEIHAHNLCGLSANFGLDALSDVAKQLERQAKNNREQEVMVRTVERLKPVYEASKKKLGKVLDEAFLKKKK